MGYQALLFCPDEKTARTVTQVLSELEFNVEACTEPFAAVKRLMGEHFDAIVVDCDNEQNATLLFKSARTSTSNQASLAVAVVEGQAGVAKAFRIGANLVLTKPINVEQAKGTLRVARGLLRKGEPAKPNAAALSIASPAAPAPAKAVPLRPAPTAIVTPRPVPSVPKPAAIPDPVVTEVAQAASIPATRTEDSIEIATRNAVSPTLSPVAAAPAAPKIESPVPSPILASAPAASTLGSGAASAPAPARIIEEPKIDESVPAIVTSAPDVLPETSTTKAAADDSSSSSGQAPTFTFGGANVPAESGGSKKALIGVAAAVVVAGALYLGWSHFQGNPNQAVIGSKPATTKVLVTTSPATSAASIPAPASSQPSSPSSHSAPRTNGSTAAPATASEADNSVSIPNSPATSSAKSSNVAAPDGSSLKPEPAPLVVHGGAIPVAHADAPAPDAPAPSMIGMAAPGSGGSINNLVGSSSNTPAPVLQTLNVSQGVSQGLLIKKVQPIYPATALHMQVEGPVSLIATISKSGSISAVKIVSGDALLAKAASEAVKQWKYKPYLLNGEPVEIQTQITINFKLPH